MSPATSQRIPSVDPRDWTNQVRDVFAVYEGREGWEKGSKYNFIHFFANHPPLAQAWLQYNRVLTNGDMEPVLRELIILRTAHNFGSTYEWEMHTEICRHHLGMEADWIEAVREGPDASQWSDRERNCLNAVDQLCFYHDISDELWTRLSADFDNRHIMELMFLVGSYTLLSWVLHTVRLPPEGTPARLPES